MCAYASLWIIIAQVHSRNNRIIAGYLDPNDDIMRTVLCQSIITDRTDRLTFVTLVHITHYGRYYIMYMCTYLSAELDDRGGAADIDSSGLKRSKLRLFRYCNTEYNNIIPNVECRRQYILYSIVTPRTRSLYK